MNGEFEALLLEIKEAGFLVNNLFQYLHPETGQIFWRASLCLEKNFEFAEGDSATSALRRAMRRVTAPSASLEAAKPLSKKLTLEDLGL